MQLFDVIDDDDAEALIEQHDRYEYRNCSVVRRDDRWFVCYREFQIEMYYDAQAEPHGHFTLAGALYRAAKFWREVQDGEVPRLNPDGSVKD